MLAPGVGEVEELHGVLVKGSLLLLVVLLVVGVDEHSLEEVKREVEEGRRRWGSGGGEDVATLRFLLRENSFLSFVLNSWVQNSSVIAGGAPVEIQGKCIKNTL